MDYYKEIKNELLNNEINKKIKSYSINKNDLMTYYNVGKLLIEAQGGESRAKYGNGLIKEYSIKLTEELGKRYSVTTLKRMRQLFLHVQKGAPLVHQISWSQYTILLPLKDLNKIDYYVNQIINRKLTKRQLQEAIKNKEYERLPIETKEKLIRNNSDSNITDYIKDPIIIKNKKNYDSISERVLQRMILEDIPSFLKELGEGFTFIENEYKIKIGNNYNYIDLLLFNYIYNAFVVVELKVTELKKEHIGQIEIYMNYIDKNIKKDIHYKTIGLIIVRKNNKFVLEFSSDKRILSKEYQIL